MENLAFAPALSLASKIRHKDISARELLEFYLQRVEQYNPRLNAIIFRQDEKARQRADTADAVLARGEVWGPLHGVPMTIKESFDWIGSPSTLGNPRYQDNYPQCDAVAVERLQTAGAIVFGKTNVPLMLADWQSFNDVYGTTNNPWDLTRVPGGSSGGAAAALAAGLTGLELGGDFGGSIRNPAHYCGVFGHKPTYGIVPRQGSGRPGMRLPIWASAARSHAVPTISPWHSRCWLVPQAWTRTGGGLRYRRRPSARSKTTRWR
jgi:amidase